MANEPTFRAIAGALFVLAFSISVYYRHKAARSGEKISKREEGLPILIFLRLCGLCVFIGLLLYIIYPQWMRWSTMSFPPWLRWLGAGLGTVVIPLFYWVFHSLGTNVTDTVVTRKEHTLVTHGPYRCVRHPLYSTGMIAWSGFTLLSANWFIGIMSILGFLLILTRTHTEEAKLIERFGDEYRKYMKHTGRFVPRLVR